jgi:Ca2+-binding RTX toxin-like protein
MFRIRSKAKSKLAQRQSNRKRFLTIENLENRRVLYSVTLSVDGLLNVRGTNVDDDLSLSVIAGNYAVNGADTGFSLAQVTSLRMDGRDGNDTLTLESSLPAISATLVGGNDNDTLDASAFSGDVKFGGGAGDDVLLGGSGNDFMQGDTGNDSFNGGGGDDLMRFDAEDSIANVVGGSGADRAEAFGVFASGITVDLAAQELETVRGTEFDDNLDASGVTAGVTLIGLGGDDILIGGSGNDELVGGDGNNEYYGNDGDDLMYSSNIGIGDDLFVGGAGVNYMRGRAGNDTFIAGVGSDTMDGGDGIDTVDYSGSPVAVRVELAGNGSTGGFATGDTVFAIETVIGSDFNDILIGGAADEFFYGGLGNDTISGFGGVDTIFGEEGLDFITGGEGNDVIDGGADNDDIRGGGGDDTISGGLGDDRIRGELGADSLFGNEDDDVIFSDASDIAANGGDGDDILSFAEALSAIGTIGLHYSTVGRSFELVIGSDFDDFISNEGAAEAITIRGGLGNDTLTGGLGVDLLRGNFGDDLLNGSGAADDGVTDRLEGSEDTDTAVTFATPDTLVSIEIVI